MEFKPIFEAYLWVMIVPQRSDEDYMKMALNEARTAFDSDEVPVGAIVVCKGQVIARAHNLTERLNDVTAHAEMQAVTAAANYLGGKYLNECSLFVSLEPCSMCAGALFWAQLGRLVFGAYDKKRGFSLRDQSLLHPKTEVVGGLLGNESADLLQSFFRAKR